jgi:hypothetical protein
MKKYHVVNVTVWRPAGEFNSIEAAKKFAELMAKNHSGNKFAVFDEVYLTGGANITLS